MSRKKNLKQQTIGIYTLNGVNGESAIKIKLLETGTLDQNQRIKDTSIHKYKINDHIISEIFACNITDSSLMASKTQPMLYASIALIKPLKCAVLCNIMLKFEITDDINTRDQFFSEPLYGKYFFELFKDNTSKPLDFSIDKFPGEVNIIEMIENMTKSDESIKMLEELVCIEEDLIAKKYREDYNYFNKIPKATICLDDYIDDSD